MNSYAQCGEDAIAWFWLKYKADGRYVDIGASDPFKYSNTAWFYEQGWRGVLVDPLPGRVARLRSERPGDRVVEAVVGDRESPAMLTVFESDTLSTLTAGEEYCDKGEIATGVLWVPVMPLREVMAMQASVDLLSVDVEGAELEVLESGDWAAHRPTIVIVETKKYMEATRTDGPISEFMRTVGYEVLADSGLNHLYCLPGVQT